MVEFLLSITSPLLDVRLTTAGTFDDVMSKSQLEFKGYALVGQCLLAHHRQSGFTLLLDPQNFKNLKVVTFKPKNFEEDDVEIAITHCGVCGSDVHTLKQGWGESKLPLVVGHEVVGHATRVGSNVQGIKVGDRVGVGAQIASCLQCRQCKDGFENYCPKQVDTYVSCACIYHDSPADDLYCVHQNAEYPDGTVTQGGYSTAIRANQQFVFPIPQEIESRDACSMLCGGLTVFSPLKTNGAGPGKKVGIVGIGGLGHYAILFAKALGAEVWAFTHSKDKMEDAKQLGAHHIVDTTNKVSRHVSPKSPVDD